MSKYEVTFAEWDACVADGGCGGYRPPDKGWGRGERPVINVSWDDVQGYLRWLNAKTGLEYRLPSEAEWEYAARANTDTPVSTGDCIHTRQANYDGNDDYNDCGANTGVYLAKTQPVGSYPADPRGFYDLHGNVWEWTEDCWNDNYQGAPTDGSAWRYGNCSSRVLRADIWRYFPAIDHAILKADLRRRIACPDTLWLLDTFIDSANPQEPVDLLFPGDDLLTPLERRRGLPIGNLTSQLFANLYLDRLDHFIKEVLRAPGYLRYMDDLALFHDDPAVLADWRERIAAFLIGRRLMLHPRKTFIAPTAAPAVFLGYELHAPTHAPRPSPASAAMGTAAAAGPPR